MNTLMTFSRRTTRTAPGAFLLPVLLGMGQPAEAASVTRPQQLIDVTQEFLEQSVTDYLQRNQISGRHEIAVNRLDPRLRLALCDIPLSSRQESSQPIGRVTVRVSCEGSNPWTVFVPAQVRLFRDVIVTRRPLQRDTILGEADIGLVERDVGALTQGYMTDPEQVIGTRLTRNTLNNQVLTPAQINQVDVVSKGDQVVINAKGATLNVRMTGEALVGGAVGTQIRVKNSNSGRTIKARVTGPGQVEVDM
ncbi:flagellar basal body P-ring formation chaperone FlgA [Stutzerimonas kirkiae]|uniref:Flagella basal body P-ring formation protein FlgA n=1 Tax=Stutzerimonas kirkiae TaxID=2211392 RepID=A0A4Q9R872_9GAMM|nr:flagellar basal body P-ring formation chaperone FlgA [Stutzerimonas kirkiae]TBU96807.1 flagella basal body P-ring formation protein FlgA [Stutzerimonas kirkiae]TBV01047.1 flagella basal body P-ring formation protein FlgA [Stutzerimonas kirkiae]TBV08395.1 flagella basal body P-ring formation protein FlgA [Stutzerimonas kirkiae]TBV16666.1 flagella basal body P-ring formation protein FlgA [Stutzerimonas kirkiae]